MIGFRRRRRRLLGGPGFQKMRVATLNMIFSVIYCLDLHNATFFYSCYDFLPSKLLNVHNI